MTGMKASKTYCNWPQTSKWDASGCRCGFRLIIRHWTQGKLAKFRKCFQHENVKSLKMLIVYHLAKGISSRFIFLTILQSFNCAMYWENDKLPNVHSVWMYAIFKLRNLHACLWSFYCQICGHNPWGVAKFVFLANFILSLCGATFFGEYRWIGMESFSVVIGFYKCINR